jgi:UPF0176 protein
MNNCCTYDCKEINSLPFEEQKKLRKGKKNSNDIFKKGRGENLSINQANQIEDL